MQNWNNIRPVVERVLEQQRVTNNENYRGEPCFLTAYQIAVLVDRQDSTLKGDLPIGGQGEGVEKNDSLSKQIAWHLSKAVNDGVFDGRLERRFLSLKGIDSFVFNEVNTPSASEISMFRLRSA